MNTSVKAPTAQQKCSISPITGTFGARIADLDVAGLGTGDAEWIRELLREHKVLVFPRQQHVGPRELAAFGRLLGDVSVAPHHMHAEAEGEPAVKILVMDMVTGGVGLPNPWHTDGCNGEAGRHGGHSLHVSILQAVDVPDYGRDTAFTDMEAAYDHLSKPLQDMLEGLTAHFNWDSRPDWPGAEHLVIFTDPVNGRKALYVNPNYTKRILQLHPRESDHLLRCLFEMANHPLLQLRVSWKPGDIVMWDNRKTQHAIIFDRAYRRTMHRVQVVLPE